MGRKMFRRSLKASEFFGPNALITRASKLNMPIGYVPKVPTPSRDGFARRVSQLDQDWPLNPNGAAHTSPPSRDVI